MKILHVCSNYFPAHGGPQYTMRHLSENLVQYYNDEVEVATSNSLYGPEMTLFTAIEPSVEMINEVKVNRFAFRRWHYPLITFGGRAYKKIFNKTLPHQLNKYRWELDCKRIDQMMDDSDVDVIMATTANYMFCDYPFRRSHTKRPKPFVLYGAIHLHINWPSDAAVIKRAKACDCYIANTDFEKNKMIEYGVQRDKILTIGTGITAEDYQCEQTDVVAFRGKYNIQEGEVLIGHIGRLSEGKGTAILLDAFREINKQYKHAKLLLAGTPTDFTETLRQKIAHYNLPVVLLENFEDKQKPVLFNALDIFILASKGESFGVVFMEAWACKKPVIGVDSGAVASLIEKGKDGILFMPDNREELVDAIEKLLLNDLMREEFGKNGYRKIKQQYNWQVITEKYREAYQLAIRNYIKYQDN